MIALIRYTSATMLHSQRYLAPVLLCLAAVGMASSPDSGPLIPVYALCAGALFVCATWLTIALISNDDPVQRAITVVSSGSSGRVLLASISVALLGCLILASVGVLLPMLAGKHSVTLADLIVGIEAELTCAAMGISIGMLCSRLVFRRQGYALITATALVVTLLLIPGLPPVNVLLRLLVNATRSADLILPVSGLLGIAAVVLVSSSCATQFITTRRD